VFLTVCCELLARQLIDEMVERVGMADYLSAVISAVKTHPTNPQIQGLG